jgi:non-lysosomal glucosylceramidase
MCAGRSNGRAMLCTGLRSATLFGYAKSYHSLQTIYNFNVTKVRCGRYGAVNGMCLDGSVDETLLQSHEIGGVTYALSAAMIYEGMHEEAFQTANGVFLVSWSEFGLVTFSPFPSCIPVFATER